MKNICFICSIFFAVNTVAAQSIRSSWAYHWGNAEPAAAPGMDLDAEANVIEAGSFKGTVDFNPGPGTSVFTSAFGGFGTDSYVSKFDSSGNFLWVKTWLSSGVHIARKVVTDTDGNIFFAGYYSGTSDFDPGPGTTNLTSTGFKDDLFIVKLNQDGNFQWAFSSQGLGNKYVSTLTLDDQGNLVVAGIFNGTADFDPGPDDVSFTSTGYFGDLFFAKYDPDGNLLWANSSLGNFQGGVNGAATDSEGNIFFGGAFDDRRDFDPGSDSTILQATGLWDAFLLKLNASGDFQWVHHLGNDDDNWIHSIAINDEDEIYAAGHFGGTMDFDPGPDQELLTATLTDPFVWKLNKDGGMIWIDQFEGTSFDQALSIDLDHQENIYVTGFYGEVVDFDPGPGHYELTSAGNNDFDDVFVTKLTPDGDLAWAYTAGGTGNDLGRGIQVDSQGSVYITGLFEGKGGFFPDHSGADSLISAGASDVFLIRWTQCLETRSELNVTSCDAAYFSPSGNHAWTVDGTYADTLLNEAGCDSILSIHLQFIHLNTEVEYVIGSPGYMHAIEENATYQWVDCSNGFTPVTGETDQDFYATLDGEYAVIVSLEDCIDTSACFLLTTSLEHELSAIPVSLFPNPANKAFYLEFQQESYDMDISVHDVYGRILFSKSYPAARKFYIEPQLGPGIYLVRIKLSAGEKLMRILID